MIDKKTEGDRQKGLKVELILFLIFIQLNNP